jgi:hypothetical protein
MMAAAEPDVHAASGAGSVGRHHRVGANHETPWVLGVG